MFLASTSTVAVADAGFAMYAIAVVIFIILLTIAPIMIWHWTGNTCKELRKLSATERDELERLRGIEREMHALVAEVGTLVKVTAQVAINQESLVAYLAQVQLGTPIEGINEAVDVNSITRTTAKAGKCVIKTGRSELASKTKSASFTL